MAHVRKPLISATVLNTGICLIEAFAGYQANSLSLLMDSVHNLSDELALVWYHLKNPGLKAHAPAGCHDGGKLAS